MCTDGLQEAGQGWYRNHIKNSVKVITAFWDSALTVRVKEIYN